MARFSLVQVWCSWVDLVKPSRLGQTWSTQRVDSVNSACRHEDSGYCRMHASKPHLGNNITKLYLASYAQEYSGCFSNNGTVGIGEPCGDEYLVGVHFQEVLDYLLPLCNEDTSPVTPALIISGCDSRIKLIW
ncbi:hypothetical protein Hdeb2414_s0031g00709491 [Helianthus debilis subsp. tardiflorus]